MVADAKQTPVVAVWEKGAYCLDTMRQILLSSVAILWIGMQRLSSGRTPTGFSLWFGLRSPLGKGL
jgi:hypothetical protein